MFIIRIFSKYIGFFVLFIKAAAKINIPSTKDGQHCLLFSDSDSLNAITTSKDVIFNI